MIFDFRSVGNHSPIMINNEPIRQAASYKYLGLLIDKLSWEVHVDNLCRKVQQKCTFYGGSDFLVSCCCFIMPVLNPLYCMV